MTKEQLENMLCSKIPLVNHMGIKVVKADIESVEILANLEKNRNHRGTAFGGSISSVLTLAAWSWLTHYLDLNELEDKTEVVIQNCTNNFIKPIRSDFIARAQKPEERVCKKFLETLKKKGAARIEIQSQVKEAGLLKAKFIGQFVAMTTFGDN